MGTIQFNSCIYILAMIDFNIFFFIISTICIIIVVQKFHNWSAMPSIKVMGFFYARYSPYAVHYPRAVFIMDPASPVVDFCNGKGCTAFKAIRNFLYHANKHNNRPGENPGTAEGSAPHRCVLASLHLFQTQQSDHQMYPSWIQLWITRIHASRSAGSAHPKTDCRPSGLHNSYELSTDFN